ncbi:MAG: hypothetical protein AVDCRST_MAG54-1526, partial [uncultured Actinomycetospora sp.]
GGRGEATGAARPRAVARRRPPRRADGRRRARCPGLPHRDPLRRPRHRRDLRGRGPRGRRRAARGPDEPAGAAVGRPALGALRPLPRVARPPGALPAVRAARRRPARPRRRRRRRPVPRHDDQPGRLQPGRRRGQRRRPPRRPQDDRAAARAHRRRRDAGQPAPRPGGGEPRRHPGPRHPGPAPDPRARRLRRAGLRGVRARRPDLRHRDPRLARVPRRLVVRRAPCLPGPADRARRPAPVHRARARHRHPGGARHGHGLRGRRAL